MLQLGRWFSLSVICCSVVLTTACGGSGGGSDDPIAVPTGKSTTQNGITLVEDLSLNQNLSGVWIEYSDVEFTTQTQQDDEVIRTQARETARKTIFVIDNDGEDLIIRDCLQFATDIAEGSNTIEFTLGTARYVLEKTSNTRLQGNFDFDADATIGSAAGQGATDIVKVARGPAVLSELLLGNFNIGALEYSVYGGAAQQMDVQCISDSVGTATVSKGDAPATSYSYSGVVVETVWGDFLSLTTNSGLAGSNRLAASLFGSVLEITKEAESDFVTFSASGTDNINIEFEANAARYADETVDPATVTLSGKVNLAL